MFKCKAAALGRRKIPLRLHFMEMMKCQSGAFGVSMSTNWRFGLFQTRRSRETGCDRHVAREGEKDAIEEREQ